MAMSKDGQCYRGRWLLECQGQARQIVLPGDSLAYMGALRPSRAFSVSRHPDRLWPW